MRMIYANQLNLLVLKGFVKSFFRIFVFLLLIIVIVFCIELVSSFLRWYDYCFAYYEVHYFPATSFFTVLMTKIRPEQQRKCKF